MHKRALGSTGFDAGARGPGLARLEARRGGADRIGNRGSTSTISPPRQNLKLDASAIARLDEASG